MQVKIVKKEREREGGGKGERERTLAVPIISSHYVLPSEYDVVKC